MPRFLILVMVLTMSGAAGCQFDPFYDGPPPPMMSTGAPCGNRAVDAGICPRVGYKVPTGLNY